MQCCNSFVRTWLSLLVIGSFSPVVAERQIFREVVKWSLQKMYFSADEFLSSHPFFLLINAEQHWLTGWVQRVILKGVTSNWQPVTGGVQQGSIISPVLFITDLDLGLKGILSKVTDDAHLRGAVDSLEGREALQSDLNK